MAVLTIATALQIAVRCAPGVPPETLLPVAHVETGLSEFDVGDNTTHRSYRPKTLQEAVAVATRLIAAGHSLDLGITQINTAAGHLQRRNLPIAAAFDACTALRIGGEVFAECYSRTSGPDEQARLKAASGCYNGDRTGAYAARVWKAAAFVVPAIQVAGVPAASSESTPPQQPPAPLCAPAWDGWALAECNAHPPAPTAAPVQPGAAIITATIGSTHADE